jgi:hypothetical protein
MRGKKTPFSLSETPPAREAVVNSRLYRTFDKRILTRCLVVGTEELSNGSVPDANAPRIPVPFQSVDEYLCGYGPKPEQPTPPVVESALIQGPDPVSNELGPIHKSKNGLNGYNEEDMKRLESMLAQLNLESDDEHDSQVAISEQNDSKTPRHESPEPPITYTVHKVLPSEDDSTVRLTLPVYNSMLQDRDKYKVASERLQETVARMQEKLASGSSVANDLVLKKNTSKMVPKSEMDAALRKKDQTIRHLQDAVVSRLPFEAQAKQLQVELNNARASEAATISHAEHKISKVVKSKDLVITRLTKRLESADLQKDKAINTLNEERAAHSCDAKNRKDLVDSLTLQDKTIAELGAALEAEKAQKTHLVFQLQQQHNRPDPSKQITNLQDQLESKTKEASTLHNNLRVAEKKISTDEAIIKRLSSENGSLRGSIHLVEPAAKAKLPKTILGCVECYVTNRTCDNRAPCHNCRDNDEKCKRWKCALKHLTKTCPYYPMCPLKHCEDGWLVGAQERPTW